MAIKINIIKPNKANKKKNKNKNQNQNCISKANNPKEIICYNFNKKNYFIIFCLVSLKN